MSVHDPIADALTIIRNGCRAKKEAVTIPFSTKMENILAILKKEGYINDFKKVEVKDKNFFRIEIDLKYYEGSSVIEGIQRVSTPGLRVYTSVDTRPQVKNGFGISVISTSKGVMTDKEARKEKVGGEVLCYVW